MRTGRLWQLVAEPDMPSEPSIRSLIRSRTDFPILEKADGSRGYVFDLDAASDFVRAHWRDKRGVSQADPATPALAPPAARGATRTGNLWDLAALPGMPSQPTLRAFIDARMDFPVITRGGRGRCYLLDLDAASAFVREHWRDRRAGRAVGASPVGRPGPGDPSVQTDLPDLFAGLTGEEAPI